MYEPARQIVQLVCPMLVYQAAVRHGCRPYGDISLVISPFAFQQGIAPTLLIARAGRSGELERSNTHQISSIHFDLQTQTRASRPKSVAFAPPTDIETASDSFAD